MDQHLFESSPPGVKTCFKFCDAFAYLKSKFEASAGSGRWRQALECQRLAAAMTYGNPKFECVNHSLLFVQLRFLDDLWNTLCRYFPTLAIIAIGELITRLDGFSTPPSPWASLLSRTQKFKKNAVDDRMFDGLFYSEFLFSDDGKKFLLFEPECPFHDTSTTLSVPTSPGTTGSSSVSGSTSNKRKSTTAFRAATVESASSSDSDEPSSKKRKAGVKK